MIVMGDAMAHMQISTETVYDSAQRIRRLAHELLELARLRDKVRRAEARQKARGKFSRRDRRKRVRHALKIRYRLFRANSSESLLATTAKCLHRELQWPPALDLGVVDVGHTNVLYSFGVMLKFKTADLRYRAPRQANRRIKARTYVDGTQLGMRSGPCWKC
jgi:hypothetical protein